MMKSFFKKLAFVMALAMVVSLAAPAAAVAATEVKIAYQNGSAISEVNLAKVGDVEDLKFTGAPDYKEAGFEWISSNPAVATVNQKGEVEAVAAGTANVTIKIGTDREATVVVNVVDLPTYTATMGLSKDDLKTEATLDLEDNKTIDLAFFGIKDYDKNRYNCNWYSVDEAVATVDNKGLVTAVAEGKTVISLGVYNVVTGKKHAVASCTVTVKGAEPTATPTPVAESNKFTAVQKDTDKFVLTFESAKTAEAVKENLTISVKIGEKDYPISFENVTVDGNKVTVTTYALFENGEVYTLTYADHTENCDIVIGDIVRVGAKYYTGKNKNNNVAYVIEEEENDYVTLIPVLFDQYGNDVTAKYNLNDFDFTYEVSENVEPMYIFNDVFAFKAAGVATVNISAFWITEGGEPMEAPGTVTFPVEKRGGIVLTLEKAGIIASEWFSNDDIYTYVTGTGDVADEEDIKDSKVLSFQNDANSAIWNNGPTTTLTYYSDDTDHYYYTAVFADNRGNLTTSNAVYQHGTFEYESTNNEVLTITDTTGEVELLKDGRANILVYFTPADGKGTKKLVASTAVVVKEEPYPVSYEVTATQTTASHVLDDGFNDVKYTIKFYDQNGKQYTRKSGLEALAKYTKIEARDTNNTALRQIEAKRDGNVLVCKIDADVFEADFVEYKDEAHKVVAKLLNNSKQYSYKVSLEDADITKNIKTPYRVFSLTVKNTKEEADILRNFIDSTAIGFKREWKEVDDETQTATWEYVPAIGQKEGYVPANYKFNISFSGSGTTDVAVKNVIGYNNTWAQATEKGAGVSATYLSTGNLALGNVPYELIVEKDDATTGHAGYVYYKVSHPANTTIAGKVEKNTAWGYGVSDGYVGFGFNAAEITYQEVDGELVIKEYLKDDEGNYIYDFNGDDFDNPKWEKVPVYVPVDYDFQYAGNGAYTVSLYTTRTEGKNLANVKTSTITVKNSQNQVKYLGLNPEFEGVTEKTITKGMENTAAGLTDIEAIVREQLMFSFDEIFLGEYFEIADEWATVTLNLAKSKFTVSNDSLTVSTLAFDVTVDDGNADTTYTYTSMVSVGARIKEK